MRTPDRLSLESLLLDLLTEKKTRHEVAEWAREALRRKKSYRDPVIEEVLEGLAVVDAHTGNQSRPHRVTEDAMRNWMHRLKTGLF